MRKFDEIALYAAVRHQRTQEELEPVDKIGATLGIHPKRALDLADKWCDKGWWEFGCSLRYGWFTTEAPAALKVWGVTP